MVLFPYDVKEPFLTWSVLGAHGKTEAFSV